MKSLTKIKLLLGIGVLSVLTNISFQCLSEKDYIYFSAFLVMSITQIFVLIKTIQEDFEER